MIDSSGLASLHRSDTKLLVYSPFLEGLTAQGRERAKAWLARHFEQIGSRSTIDLRQRFG